MRVVAKYQSLFELVQTWCMYFEDFLCEAGARSVKMENDAVSRAAEHKISKNRYTMFVHDLKKFILQQPVIILMFSE
jgi:hypothetical protein